ncbi:hypothetical protein [Sphingomonas sp. PAMC 26621]|uniref:hypothetical protein n=1 Tax=Sphingomonas sp. PAMC 26621 TaxID=1112213 RepID=UPI0011114E11|nr:hypothetical protein [Sphingomonas sp. PAMC 26621]
MSAIGRFLPSQKGTLSQQPGRQEATTSGHWQPALSQSYQPMDTTTQPNEAALPSIVFAPWKTPVENDELSFVSLSYGGASTIVDCHSEGFSLEVPASGSLGAGDLEAVFLSVEKKSVVIFRFGDRWRSVF